MLTGAGADHASRYAGRTAAACDPTPDRASHTASDRASHTARPDRSLGRHETPLPRDPGARAWPSSLLLSPRSVSCLTHAAQTGRQLHGAVVRSYAPGADEEEREVVAPPSPPRRSIAAEARRIDSTNAFDFGPRAAEPLYSPPPAHPQAYQQPYEHPYETQYPVAMSPRAWDADGSHSPSGAAPSPLPAAPAPEHSSPVPLPTPQPESPALRPRAGAASASGTVRVSIRAMTPDEAPPPRPVRASVKVTAASVAAATAAAAAPPTGRSLAGLSSLSRSLSSADSVLVSVASSRGCCDCADGLW
jgi:hypothetical protein